MNPGKSPFSVGIKSNKNDGDFPRWLKTFAKNVFYAILALILTALLLLVAGVTGRTGQWVWSWFA